jgi:hypothetical protein
MKSSNDKNTNGGKPIKPVLIYCILGAVVIFNVVLYLYVMDRLAQLDKLKEDLIKTTDQYQEVPIPDLMKEKIDQMERESQNASQAQKKGSAELQDKPSVPPQKLPAKSQH